MPHGIQLLPIIYSILQMAFFSSNSEPCAVAKTLAQQRRHMENEEFSLLSRELPLARAISGQHIDKTTMVRLAVAYIKLHRSLTFPLDPTTEFDNYWSSHPLELMDSFFIVLGTTGDIHYVSETISIYLGLSQIEMMGHNIVDYVHPDDWIRFQTVFQSTSNEPEIVNVRLRSSLTKRVTKDSARASPGFKVIRLEISSRGATKLFHCNPLPSLVLSTISIQNNSFVLTANLDLKIINYDDRAEQILGELYSHNSLKHISFYHLIHVADVEVVRKMHCEVFALGAYKTPYYRMQIHRSQQTFFVESNVYRYSSMNIKKIPLETITIVTSCL